jgi:hypothetical protein
MPNDTYDEFESDIRQFINNLPKRIDEYETMLSENRIWLGRTVGIGVIGLGWFGEIHCETIAGVPNMELVALCTRRPERLAEQTRKFGVKKTYRDYRDLLADTPRVDFIKLAVQGAEVSVLRGARQTLARHAALRILCDVSPPLLERSGVGASTAHAGGVMRLRQRPATATIRGMA